MTDTRRADEFRIPAASLKAGDLVNLAPGDDDWQEVLAVHTAAATATDPSTRTFLASLGGNYVYVEVTDLASVDNTVYIDSDGLGRVNGEDGEDFPVSELLSDSGAIRIYLFTKYELVTVRS
ncbi:MAG TPA: hypothetical protein VGL26_07320 [Jatrophihabitans sp.]|jgi:hypothetical protein